MSNLLRESIKTLTSVVNVTSGLAHPFDEARAKELFRALYKEGEALDYGEVKMLALENKWPERHAEKLAKLAAQIGGGGRVVVKHPREWGEPMVARIKKELSAKDKK